MRLFVLILFVIFLFPPTADAAALGSPLISCQGSSAVYYLDRQSTRHAFPNEATYFSWYADFSRITAIPTYACAKYPLGKNATVRPGIVLLKIPSIPTVYAVSAPNTLRPIESEEIARTLYGDSWNLPGPQGPLRDLSETFFANYVKGAPLTAASDFRPSDESAACANLDECLSLPSALSYGFSDPSAALTPTNLLLPLPGAAAYDPLFSLSAKRISDPLKFSHPTKETPEPFNADGTLVLLDEDEETVVRDLHTLATVYRIPANRQLPKWDPTSANALYFFSENNASDDNKIHLYRVQVRTGIEEEIGVMPSPFNRIRTAVSRNAISQDGKWLVFLAGHIDNEGIWSMIAYDLKTTSLVQSTVIVDHTAHQACDDLDADLLEIQPSPLGHFAVLRWETPETPEEKSADPCTGVEIHDLKTGSYLGHVSNHPFAGDMGVNKNGDEIYVTTNQTRTGLRLVSTTLPGSVRFQDGYTHELLPIQEGRVGSISCHSGNGWCAMGSNKPAAENTPLLGELFLVGTDTKTLGAPAPTNRLFFHRSSACVDKSTPRPAWSADGSKILFASDWGICRGRSYSFLLPLPH
ncbi:PD40 domain-containing protein [Candidatus Uhrbacteria bacterium]|nr:PD40 domain-containing protein [Candidatus Uhrbacteria bacterium]